MRSAIVVAFGDAALRTFIMVHHRERGWEFPGGKMEPGESPLAAAQREFFEETGRRLDAAHLVADDCGQGVLVTGFSGVRLTPVSDDAIDDVACVSSLPEPLSFSRDESRDFIERARRSLS